MRWFLILLFLVYYSESNGQIIKTWIGDTARVFRSVYDGDTSYTIRTKFRSGTWEIYYDSEFRHRAGWCKFESEYFFDDSCWYRNGGLKKYWISKERTVMGCYESKSWHEDGKMRSENYCNGDTALHVEYYRNGQIKQVLKSHKDSTSNWMFEHYMAEYYENGQLKHDPTNINGPRRNFRFYYESGKVSKEIKFQNDSTISHCQEWYQTGGIKAEGQYLLEAHLMNIGPVKKTGKWSYYNESGKIIKEEFYEEGKLVSTIEY